MLESMDGVFIVKSAKFIAAGLCMAIGGFGSAIGQGFIGGKACESIGKTPSAEKELTRAAIYCIILVETSTIFALVVSLLLIFVG